MRAIEALDAESGNDNPQRQASRFRIVVLDTVTMLLGPQLSAVSSQGNVTPPLSPSSPCEYICQAVRGEADEDHNRLPLGHAEMTTFMRLLREAAQKHGLCILVRIRSLSLASPPFWISVKAQNLDERAYQMLNDATAAGRPALGASFTFMADATLWLASVPGQDRELRTAEVLRSRVSVRRMFSLFFFWFL